MKRNLKTLMEGYLSRQVTTTGVPDFLTEIFVEQNLPVTVDENQWIMGTQPERLIRVFKFLSIELRNYFLSEILAYEETSGHYGKLCVEGLSLTIEVFTHDLMRVTELDTDYADQCDSIFSDIGLWSNDE